jgi:hypothetical protein
VRGTNSEQRLHERRLGEHTVLAARAQHKAAK